MNDFSKTEWSKFYSCYRELNQKQLQKSLLHFELEKDKMVRDWRSPYWRMSHIRHLLYGDPVLPKYSKDMTMWMKYTKPFEDYLDMMIPQFEEVKTYYQRQKEEHDDLRKQKKVEKVECERCNAMVSRTNLSKHMATFRCRSGE